MNVRISKQPANPRSTTTGATYARNQRGRGYAEPEGFRLPLCHSLSRESSSLFHCIDQMMTSPPFPGDGNELTLFLTSVKRTERKVLLSVVRSVP